MQIYEWKGWSRGWKIERGELSAPNEAAVKEELRRQDILPVKIRLKSKDIQLPRFRRNKVSQKEIALITRQLATMTGAGLPIAHCLESISKHQISPVLKETLLRVKGDILAGMSFAEALKKHPWIFNEFFCNLVVAGEAGGFLNTVLERLASYIEKAIDLQKKVRGALVYPAAVTTIALGVMVLLLLFVVPVFQKMFSDMGSVLPAYTRLVIELSEMMQTYFWVIIVLGLFFFFLARRYYRMELGRERVDDYLLRLPFLGGLFKKFAVAKFTRTMATMVASGVPILEGLKIVARTSGNKALEKSLQKTHKAIEGGGTIAETMEKAGIFPSMVVEMIAVGESTGTLDAMLNKVADFYEDEVDTAVAALMSLLEPFLLVFLGVTIGALVIAMYLPLFKLPSILGN